MVATLDKYRSQLVEWIQQYSDDSDYSYRYYEDLIVTWTNKWFCNTYEKFNKTIPELYYQTIECLEIEQADQADCCEFNSDCTIMRSVLEVPQFRALSDGELFVKAWPVSVVENPKNLFEIIKFERADSYGNLRYNSNRIGAFYYKNRIYLISKNFPTLSLIDKINIRGIFRDPRDVGRFTNCSNKPCYTNESPFPLEERLWTYCFEDLKKVLIEKLEIPQDVINNDKADLDENKGGS